MASVMMLCAKGLALVSSDLRLDRWTDVGRQTLVCTQYNTAARLVFTSAPTCHILSVSNRSSNLSMIVYTGLEV